MGGGIAGGASGCAGPLMGGGAGVAGRRSAVQMGRPNREALGAGHTSQAICFNAIHQPDLLLPTMGCAHTGATWVGVVNRRSHFEHMRVFLDMIELLREAFGVEGY